MRKNIENIKNTSKVQMLVPILEPLARLFPGVARLFRDFFVRYLWGVSPWTDFDIQIKYEMCVNKPKQTT